MGSWLLLQKIPFKNCFIGHLLQSSTLISLQLALAAVYKSWYLPAIGSDAWWHCLLGAVVRRIGASFWVVLSGRSTIIYRNSRPEVNLV